jgi:hypothetical protein
MPRQSTRLTKFLVYAQKDRRRPAAQLVEIGKEELGLREGARETVENPPASGQVPPADPPDLRIRK